MTSHLVNILAGEDGASVRMNTTPARMGLCARWGGLVKMLEGFIREKVWISEGMHTVKHTEIIGQCGYSAST